MSNIVIYEDGNVNLELSIEDKTIWLNAEDIASIFGVNRPAIVKHIGNIYKSEELVKDATCSILEQVAKDGRNRRINYYNLDMIISVGYRVNSTKATRFRKWATDVLNRYLIQGYALNKDKLKQQKLQELDQTIQLINQNIIGAYLFVLFLHKNGILYKPNGETRINDNALASIALLVAQSSPSQKDIIIKLVMNMLYEEQVNE